MEGFCIEKKGWGIDSFNSPQFVTAEELKRPSAYFKTMAEAEAEAEAVKLPKFEVSGSGVDKGWKGSYRVVREDEPWVEF